MKTKQALRAVILPAVLVAGTACASPPEGKRHRRPSISVHPEIYIFGDDFTEDQEPKPDTLPWPLKITLRVSDKHGDNLTGPLTLTAMENMAGASFQSSETVSAFTPEPTSQSSETNAESAVPTDTTAAAQASVKFQELDFAVFVEPMGANLLRMRCFVGVTISEEGSTKRYQTATAIECRRARRTQLVEFPGVRISVKADWSKDSPYLSE